MDENLEEGYTSLLSSFLYAAMRKDNIYWVNGKEEGQNNNMQHVGNLILEGSNFKKGLEIKTL